MSLRIGSHTISAPVSDPKLACAIDLDDAAHALSAAYDHFLLLGNKEGAERVRMAQAATTDAVDALHADDPQEDDDE